ncbi:stage II sporulation protein AA (anti-sigma F factor antagonist) [Salinibacillus kushneri]|uniref:Anti-sigma F factor antagonist n=1 Tax=Salinibacillus kushneri TaxID=237682 RepID=A0A1I0HWH3_9BACI|nr:anti-sigma F factor antagonist [Salinibacillus kushneri]SET88595.1 stage II sporulation protein AA (anti-sigma F factor antagonist) [Salinibacillus kushneri]
MSLSVQFESKHHVLLVRLSGELDHHTSEDLKHQWQSEMKKADIQHVIVNMESLSFMDSSGLGVMLGRYKEVQELGGEMVVCSLSQSVRRLFELSGLFKIVRLEENEDAALKKLGVAS